MNWLREAVSDGRTGKASSKRLAMLIACAALALAVIILAVAAYFGRDVAVALGSVAVPLAGIGGFSYVGGKGAEAKRRDGGKDSP